MTHTSILRSLSLAVIGSLWQRVARSIRVSLRSLSSELHLSQETACRRPETYRSAFAAARQSRGFSGGLRLSCSSVDFVSLTVPRPTIPASPPLAVIGSLWQRVALSIQASLRSLSSELYLSQETACRRPETYRSAFAAARQSRGFSGGLRLSCSDFAYARLHWRQHVAVGRGQSPFASGSASWASLADCVSAAQASTSSRFRRRQHVSTCLVIGKLS